MKTVTIRFEFPDNYNHKEVVETINGTITDMDKELANELTYTILERTTT